MKPSVRLFKKTKRYISFTAFIALLIFTLTFAYFSWSYQEFFLLVVAMVFLVLSSSALAAFRYKKGLRKVEDVVNCSDLTRDIKRAEVLLEVGQLSSWQFSNKVGILRLDYSEHSVLGHTKLYYSYEELIRNKDIKRIFNAVQDSGVEYVDDEVYFPLIKKWVIVRGRCVEVDSSGEPNQFIGVIIDNTERREIHKQLELLSVTDELTSLKNRRYFFDSLKREISLFNREKTLFSVAMFDLDYFKRINDSFGHRAGDFILKTFAQELLSEVRPYDLVARIGGEEFIILFPGIGKLEAEKIVRRIKDKVVASPPFFEGTLIEYTFSCGLGDASELSLYTEEEFITIIDSRLYSAKDSGRNLIVARSEV